MGEVRTIIVCSWQDCPFVADATTRFAAKYHLSPREREVLELIIDNNDIATIAEKLIKGETPSHAQLGVTLSSVTPSVAQRNGLSANYGAYVTSVNEGTGASEAGLQPGDIIVSFNGAKVESSSDVMVDIRACNPGDTVTLGINRDGKTLELSVKLGESGGVAESSGSERDASSFFNGRSRP